ncbi:hypothetical protein [Paraburkholderia domus]|jgi:hypothetical protein|uniref:hypothetical protein n=1 Tax=Paraburkholderia domus TaxID=2793075 RepID=UPI001912B5F5|nr:hypothetical protein [Paraburkholderia domus]MBK5065661.1 hypothetical protein [Burkholderia sp. R-70199]CAE6961103.1 hypothetical protein R70199_07328 [Paraburkholderia domus]
MSQPHGRYSGSRDKGPRQSRQPSNTTSLRQNRPYVKPPPARDPAQTASIFKTRSFKWLVDAVGAENIALGLDSNLARVAELISGERFTPETAFHIETTLGLPDGFFDQPNPALSAETINRLRAPLNVIRANPEPESADGDALEPAPAIPANHHPTSADRLPKESEMSKRTAGESPQAVAKRNRTAAGAATAPSSKPASAKAKASRKSGVQQSLPLDDVAALQNVRRANLHVLTSRKGSKVRLSAVMSISASNLDNRLYGQKRMDDAEANRFTERLGLQTAWLDVPRSVSDIPESVSALLDPLSGPPASDQQKLPAAKMPEAAVARKSARRKAKAASDRHAAPSEAAHVSDAAVTKAVEQQVSELPSASDLAIRQPVDNDVPSSASHQQPATTPVTEVIAEPRRSAPVTSLDDLIGIEPIAEALIKTLAGKARTGRLDEMKALELLRQIVAL